MNRQQNELFNQVLSATKSHIVREMPSGFTDIEPSMSLWEVGQKLQELGFSNKFWSEYHQKWNVIDRGYYHETLKMVANITLSGKITVSISE